ncbi:MAG: class I SAM-dependent methyltransferase [Acetobacteraceae bacterium]|nr:class I SAM-dependent methyltransferase [Acetobacteraceae bacterium]
MQSACGVPTCHGSGRVRILPARWKRGGDGPTARVRTSVGPRPCISGARAHHSRPTLLHTEPGAAEVSASEGLLDGVLHRLIRTGELGVIWPDGRTSRYGPGGEPSARLRIADSATARAILLNPALRFGEAYMDAKLTPVDCSIYQVLDVLLASMGSGAAHPLAAVLDRGSFWLRRLLQWNTPHQARRHVAHHYDLNGRLYALFLDRDRQYSCGYFPRGDETIEQAQAAKKRHIAAKLCLDRPELSVLDIGCGWGGLALHLAREHGALVLGITLSSEQLQVARDRALAEGLDQRVRFELLDYRAVGESFDRVVSVGMFEHVGIPNYETFFRTVGQRLRPDGVGLVHAIGRSEGPEETNAWLRKYIFPGGYSPALSEVLGPLERSGLKLCDLEILRLHYAETLRHWRRRFAANRDAIASLYDERLCRMFEFYLAGSELAFRRQGHMVWQAQLAHQFDAVPLARDYITDADRATSPQSTGV